MAQSKAHCLHCRHFFITWEQPFRYGCRSYGFKAKEYPCQVVVRSSGASCQLFEEKKREVPQRNPDMQNPESTET